MAKIKIEIETNNEAFDSGQETKRILSNLSEVIEEVEDGKKIRDFNGNTVGKVTVKED